MPLLLRAAAVCFLCTLLWASTRTVSAAAAGLPAIQAAAPAAEGKEILTRKCFQCHQATMWSAVRGDRKAWESVLYRMVGRGALWTEAEINAMADFLAQTRGPR